jgi:uncharacterized protein
MVDDPAEVVRRHLDAFNAADLDGLMRGFSDDATWVTGTETVRGTAALKTFFAAAFADLSPQLRVESILAEGDRVACELREDYVADGVGRTDHIAGFYRVSDGRITAAKIYREGSAEV